MTTSTKYKFSFTGGGLLAKEATIVVPLYLELQDWKNVRTQIKSENLLQFRTVSTGERLGGELIKRLSTLSLEELELFADALAEERSQLMWVATCRQYSFIAEFAEEVLREKFLVLQPDLKYNDFDNFLRSKSLWHEEIDQLKESTVKHLRVNLFQMMREANLLSKTDQIIQAHISSRVTSVLTGSIPSELRFFPCTDANFEGSGI